MLDLYVIKEHVHVAAVAHAGRHVAVLGHGELDGERLVASAGGAAELLQLRVKEGGVAAEDKQAYVTLGHALRQLLQARAGPRSSTYGTPPAGTISYAADEPDHWFVSVW